jgi:hypothetical protein
VVEAGAPDFEARTGVIEPGAPNVEARPRVVAVIGSSVATVVRTGVLAIVLLGDLVVAVGVVVIALSQAQRR